MFHSEPEDVCQQIRVNSSSDPTSISSSLSTETSPRRCRAFQALRAWRSQGLSWPPFARSPAMRQVHRNLQYCERPGTRLPDHAHRILLEARVGTDQGNVLFQAL